MKQIRERRQCRSYTPYIFFILELVIYIELAYLIYSILDGGKLTLAVIALILSYQFTKSMSRLLHVKNRCKSVESYKKFQKKAQEKLLKEGISK